MKVSAVSLVVDLHSHSHLQLWVPTERSRLPDKRVCAQPETQLLCSVIIEEP